MNETVTPGPAGGKELLSKEAKIPVPDVCTGLERKEQKDLKIWVVKSVTNGNFEKMQ
jgi:hypothetical protein